MKTKLKHLLILTLVAASFFGCGPKASKLGRPEADENLSQQEPMDLSEEDMAIFGHTAVSTPTPGPVIEETAVPLPIELPEIAQPITEPTPTPDPNTPTVEMANEKIEALQKTRRELEYRIADMTKIISDEERTIQKDWDALQSNYNDALRKAEDSATETRFKRVKRRDYYGREYWTSVPYEQKQMGANAKVAQVNNQFRKAKNALTARHAQIQRKNDILATAVAEIREQEARIDHLHKWIDDNENEI